MSTVLSNSLTKLDWGFVDEETSYLTHGIHRYSGKYIPQIAARLIENLTVPGELIVDPFVGSGTTLVEALRHQRAAIGIDLNPIACMISRVKTVPIRPDLLDAEIGQHLSIIKARAEEVAGQLTFTPPATSLPEWFDRPEFQKWFQPSVLAELRVIKASIREVAPQVRPVCEVAFSDIVRERSNAHGGYPNLMFNRKVPPKSGAVSQYSRRLLVTSSSVKQLSKVVTGGQVPQVLLASATALPLADSSVDAIITHPPYIGSVPYAEYQYLSLLWNEFDPRAIDARLMGGQRQRRDVVERFLNEIKKAAREFRRVLRPGRFAGVVIGNPTVRGSLVCLNEVFKQIFAEVDLRLVQEIERKKVNMRANKMPTEFVQIYQ